jgi:putative two-component system response regulator
MTPLRGDDERVLIVDAEPASQTALLEVLEKAGYRCEVAQDAHSARVLCAAEDFELVVADVDLPDDSGLGLVEFILAESPRTATVTVMGLDEPELADRAIELGTYSYLIKPFNPNQVLIAARNALQRRKLELENRAHRETLEQIVRARTLALERSATRLKLSREETVRRLSRAVEYRDEETGGHTERMSAYSALLAGKLGLDVESIRIASPMHDVGKVALPDNLLLRPGALDDEERAEMERHTWIGYQILAGSGSALLELGATIALTHHEKWDGTGYPRQLAGSAIPMEGQVAAVADVFDALTSDRPYRRAFSLEETIRIMRGERSKHFDPRLVDLFFENVDQLLEIRDRHMPPLITLDMPPVGVA